MSQSWRGLTGRESGWLGEKDHCDVLSSSARRSTGARRVHGARQGGAGAFVGLERDRSGSGGGGNQMANVNKQCF